MSSKVVRSNPVKAFFKAANGASERKATNIAEKRANNKNIVAFNGGMPRAYSNMPVCSAKDTAKSIGEKRADALNIVDYSAVRRSHQPVKVVEEMW
ncbi:hypothetical protein NDN08_001094 [Rhodosorus marinus]|uniref:Uncharacterized protein n=1 Tax=Rhodosorus marinus TaxID=101924 RepID=A0AAV8USU3_9RHOD|nr:hypothetical protein NDN08_001094 [Rhodosorus marinus]